MAAELFPGVERCALIGMVHLLPLPGSPRWGGTMDAVLERATSDARALISGGCDALLVENMGDLPYLRGAVGAETIAAMARVSAQVVSLGLPVGIQVLAGANRAALGIAVAVGAGFIRVEGFAYAHVADEGWIDACAGELLRARRQLGSEVRIWADVQKKHAAHMVTGDLSLGELARGTAFCGADALIVTGLATGRPTDPQDIETVRAAGLPVVVGSGVSPADAGSLAQIADGLVVGSALKIDGDWQAPVCVDRVRAVRQAMDR